MPNQYKISPFKMNPGQVGPESSRPGQLGQVNSACMGPRYGGRVVRLEGVCICMSICLSVNTYVNFSATLEVSSRESLMACQKVFQSCA